MSLIRGTALAALDLGLALCGLLRSSQAPTLRAKARAYDDAVYALGLTRLEADGYRRALESARDELRRHEMRGNKV